MAVLVLAEETVLKKEENVKTYGKYG